MVLVDDVYKTITKNPHLISKTELLEDVVKQFKDINPIHRSLYVVNEHKKLLGIITLQEIFNIYSILNNTSTLKNFSKPMLLDYLMKDSTAEEIMRVNISVTPNDDLYKATQIMIQENIHEIPVVTNEGIVIGDLNVHEILRELHINIS